MKRYPKKLILLFILVSASWFPFTQRACAATLGRAEALYLQRRYNDSIDECAVLIARNIDSEYAHYLLGLNYLKLNDTEKAREKLGYFLDKFKTSRYADVAGLAYADTYFIEQDYTRAKAGYRSLFKKASPLLSTIYLRLGQCALKSGDWQEAKNYFNTLKQDYPLSLEAAQADSLSSEGNFFFTVQVGSFANVNNAQRLLEKLKSKNFDAYIDELRLPDTRFYRVRVARLSSRQEAANLKNILDREGYSTRIFP